MRRPASPTLPRDGRADFVRLFHTFSFWRDYFLHRPTWPTLPRDGRLPFVLHSFTHALVLADLVSAQAAARNLCRNGRPQSLVVHFTHICALEKIIPAQAKLGNFTRNRRFPILRSFYTCFCPAENISLRRPTSPTLPGNGRPQLLVRPFHTFLLWNKFFLRRASPSTLPGGGRSHVVHSFYSCFSSGGARFCTGRARQLDPVTAILPLIHSFLHVFVLAKTFSRQSNPETLTGGGRLSPPLPPRCRSICSSDPLFP